VPTTVRPGARTTPDGPVRSSFLARGAGSERLALGVAVVGTAMLPLLKPKGPANTAPEDLLMALGIVVIVVWAGSVRARLRLPYIAPMAIMMVGGLIAAIINGSTSAGSQAVLQELFLLAWCGALTTLFRSARALRTVIRAWALSSIAWAGFLVGAIMLGQNGLAGVGTRAGDAAAGGGRAQLTFDHPNMTGNYFMISLFVVLASGYPKRPLVRAGGCILLLMAMLYAGSNTALLGLPIGVLVMVFVNVKRRMDLVAAFAVVIGVTLAGAVIWSAVGDPVSKSIQSSNNSLVRYSVARSSRSANARESLFQMQFNLYRKSNLIGIGPASTKDKLGAENFAAVKEAHSDYLASLVERGPLGIVGLLALFGAVGIRMMGLASPGPTKRYSEAIPNVGAICGALVAFAITGITHEVLHYRHLWTMMAMLAALHLYGRPRTGHKPAGRAAASLIPLRTDDA
jgi:O-antigen ligase